MDPQLDDLWHDALSLLDSKGVGERVVAMLGSCTPTSLEKGVFTVETWSRFVAKTLENDREVIEGCLSEVAFEPLHFVIVITDKPKPEQKVEGTSTISEEEYRRLQSTSATTIKSSRVSSSVKETSPSHDDFSFEEREREKEREWKERRENNPLVEGAKGIDSALTFESFVVGEENRMAFQAAEQVADGENKNFNPLFIYGKSGLGKTHLLKAIQNYINVHDPSRLCVYKVASEFLNDYTQAARSKNNSIISELEKNYRDIDVLIIDDFQQLKDKEGTMTFFYNIFNYLIERGKQIVLAADRQPLQLETQLHMDERVTSRVGAGMTLNVQVPNYELKYALIMSFYQRMREDYTCILSDEIIGFMAEKAGTNIRLIKAFCHSCLFLAQERNQDGLEFTQDDVKKIAKDTFKTSQKVTTIEEIQNAVEQEYGVPHNDLIGNKRNKDLMEPRHVAIWLSHELTDNTLAGIGIHFGGRSHATIKHSIGWVDETEKKDRIFFDRVSRIKDAIQEG